MAPHTEPGGFRAGGGPSVDCAAIDAPIDAPLDILVVCTGNICRSPMAEALLRRRLEERGVAAVVHSAGTATEDVPPTDEVIELMDERELDVRDHRSQLLDPDAVRAADLVLGMAREHVREVVVLDPARFAVTFTLKELVRLGEERGPRRPDESVADWLTAVGAGRTPMAHLGLGSEEDVPDPIGRRFAFYTAVATDIDEAVDRLVELLWPA